MKKLQNQVNTFEEVNNNYRSGVGKKFSKADLLNVWDTVAKYVEDNLLEQKAVVIKDFGTFTLSAWKLGIGHDKFVHVKKPVFVMSEKLIKHYNLLMKKPYTSDTIPSHLLNVTTVANVCNHPRFVVFECISEVIQAFTRKLGNNQDVEFPFSGIGKLQVRNKQVQMEFNHEFLNRIDDKYDKCATVHKVR